VISRLGTEKSRNFFYSVRTYIFSWLCVGGEDCEVLIHVLLLLLLVPRDGLWPRVQAQPPVPGDGLRPRVQAQTPVPGRGPQAILSHDGEVCVVP
jgi:hypothetical protein